MMAGLVLVLLRALFILAAFALVLLFTTARLIARRVMKTLARSGREPSPQGQAQDRVWSDRGPRRAAP